MYPIFKETANQPAPKITDEKFVSGSWTLTQKYISKDNTFAVFWVSHQSPGTGQDHAEIRFADGNGNISSAFGFFYTFRQDLDGAIKLASR
jgi:hypothetical protein